MAGKAWQNIKEKSIEFLDCFEKAAEKDNFVLADLEILLTADTPSFRINFSVEKHQVELVYSEHHLDYADGVGLKINGKQMAMYEDFGVGLARIRDSTVMDRFISVIKERQKKC